MRVGHTEVWCQSSTMIIALVAGSIDPCHPVLSFPRKKNPRRDDVLGVCPTPPLDRFSIGAGRFRVHRRSFSIPFRARRFRDRFLVSPTRGFSSCSPKADRRCRWAFDPNMSTCARCPLGWRVPSRKTRRRLEGYCSGSHPSLARSPGHTPARVAVAPRPARDRFGESLRSRLVRLEDRPFGKRSSFRETRSGLCVTPRRGSPRRTSRDMLPSMVRRYAAARRKQTRSQRLQAR